MARICVAGAGGFFGGHLVADLLRQGHEVIASDIKPVHQWFQIFNETTANYGLCDLSNLRNCQNAVAGCTEVYQLAADMGGMGFIESHKAECMLSVLVNTHMLMAARDGGVKRFFYASSACVYPDYRQDVVDVVALRESDAYPAMPEDGYGWEKLFSERMCRHFTEDFGLDTRIARFHNIYGPEGTWSGGREKAPAAVCRKVAEAVVSGNHEIEIWGDGKQTRSFMFVADAVEGTQRLMTSEVTEPLNIGSNEMVSVDHLVDLVEHIAGIRLRRYYNLSAPQGVRGRNSDNTLIRQQLGWEPSTFLRVGLEQTYRWVLEQVQNQ